VELDCINKVIRNLIYPENRYEGIGSLTAFSYM